MDKKEKIKKLEKELEQMRMRNKDVWDIYDSEFCAGAFAVAMINEEEKLEREIEKLKEDDND